VTDVIDVSDEQRLPPLRPYHIYADRVLSSRFHYKRPGITLMIVRASVAQTPILIPDSAHFGGCRSWVDLPAAIDAAGLTPALSDDEFAGRRLEILAAMSPSATI
jgi:hypothetical protein